MTIGLAAFLGLLGSGATVLLSIARSKVTAVVLGPTGIGMSAEIAQIVALTNSPVAVASGAALVSTVAEAHGRGDPEAAERAYHTALLFTIGLTVVGGAVAVVTGLWLLPEPWGRRAWPLTLLAAVGSVGTAWASLSGQMLTATGALRRLALMSVVLAAVGTGLIILGTVTFDLTGQFVAIAATGVLAVPIAVSLASSQVPHVRLWPHWTWDPGFLRRALAIGATGLIGSVATQVVLFSIRWSLEAKGGPALNGQFQAAWALAATYLGLILSSLGNFAFPRYAAAQTASALDAEISNTLAFILKTAPPVILLAIAFRAEVVRLLYSHRFDLAIDLLGLLMVGDVAKAVGWAQAGPLLYRAKVRAFLVTELTGVSALIGFSLLLIPTVGLNGVGYAYIFAHLIYAAVTAVVARFACGVQFGARRLYIAFGVTGLLAVAWLATQRTSHARWIVALIALAWAAKSGLLLSMWAGVTSRLARVRTRRA